MKIFSWLLQVLSIVNMLFIVVYSTYMNIIQPPNLIPGSFLDVLGGSLCLVNFGFATLTFIYFSIFKKILLPLLECMEFEKSQKIIICVVIVYIVYRLIFFHVNLTADDESPNNTMSILAIGLAANWIVCAVTNNIIRQI
jgi:hypothetical protein